MRVSKFAMAVLVCCLSTSFTFGQYLQVLDTSPKDAKAAFISRDSAGQAMVINNSNGANPTLNTGQTVGLDVRTGDFGGGADLAGTTALGIRSVTRGDRDISIQGSNSSICGLAAFFQGNTVVDRRLNPESCDLPLRMRMNAENVLTPGSPIPGSGGGILTRPSDLPPLNPVIPGLERSSLGGFTMFYKDVTDFYDEGLINGDGITLLPFFTPDPATGGSTDIPVLGVLNYLERYGATTMDPGTKGCPDCFTDIAFRNQIFTNDNCDDDVNTNLGTNNTAKQLRQDASTILDDFRSIQYATYEHEKSTAFQLDLESLPAYTQQRLGEGYGTGGKEWMTHLTLGVKALDEEQEDLRAENEELRDRVAELEDKMNQLLVLLDKTNQIESISTPSGRLLQNEPNPFHQQTTIHYDLPDTVQSAQLIIRDLNGQVLKTIVLEETTSGQVTLDASTLAAGTYTYSLIVDGQIIQTKQMILTQ
ncbi:MAG: T9SS type A sorting domain-containing protein [Bacteroidota bacterium]